MRVPGGTTTRLLACLLACLAPGCSLLDTAPPPAGPPAWAEAAWREDNLGGDPDLHRGYAEGFVDQVTRGGDGSQPPPAPPNPADPAVTGFRWQQYQQGFRAGTQAAIVRAARRHYTLPPEALPAPTPAEALAPARAAFGPPAFMPAHEVGTATLAPVGMPVLHGAENLPDLPARAIPPLPSGPRP